MNATAEEAFPQLNEGIALGAQLVANPHEVLAGPGSGTAAGLMLPRLLVPADIPFQAAVLNAPNAFTQPNSFSGIELLPTPTVTADYFVTLSDFEIPVDASGGPVNIFLLSTSIAMGQILHVKKVDNTTNVVSIIPAGDDLIDGSSLLALVEQWADALLINGAGDYWDNALGIQDAVIIQDPVPPAPVDVTTIVALLRSYGMCQ